MASSTTKRDALTRWLPLWEKDESLRPKSLIDFTPADRTLWMLSWGPDEGVSVPEQIAAALIRDAAVRWLLALNRGRSYIEIHTSREDSPLRAPIEIAYLGAGKAKAATLDDALYEAVRAVMENKE